MTTTTMTMTMLMTTMATMMRTMTTTMMTMTTTMTTMMMTMMMMITVVVAAVAESNSDSGCGNGNSNGWGGGVGSKGDCKGSGKDSNNGNNGGSCDSDGDNNGNDTGYDEDDSHDDDDMTVAAVRAVRATKTMVTAMAGDTNNNQLNAQLCPAHDGNKDDTPGMCLAVVAVAEMLVWEGRSATATVEVAAMVAAEEADDGRGRQRCAAYSFLVQLFFSPSLPLPLKAKATVGLLSFLPQTLLVDCCLHRFHHCCHCRCQWCCHCPHHC
jgi:hypothetical protein